MKYFLRTEDVLGLKTYKFVQTIAATQYDVLEAARRTWSVARMARRSRHLGRTPARGPCGVEPVTVRIVKGQEILKQALLGADGVATSSPCSTQRWTSVLPT